MYGMWHQATNPTVRLVDYELVFMEGGNEGIIYKLLSSVLEVWGKINMGMHSGILYKCGRMRRENCT